MANSALSMLAGFSARASVPLPQFLVSDWQGTSILVLNIPRKVEMFPNLSSSASAGSDCFSPLLAIWECQGTSRRAETRWHSRVASSSEEGESTPGWSFCRKSAGSFVSDSGAWHISGRNSKVHAKIFWGMHKLKTYSKDKHLSLKKKKKRKKKRTKTFFPQIVKCKTQSNCYYCTLGCVPQIWVYLTLLHCHIYPTFNYCLPGCLPLLPPGSPFALLNPRLIYSNVSVSSRWNIPMLIC